MPLREYKCECGKVTDQLIASTQPIPPKILCDCGEWAEYNSLALTGYRRDHSMKGEPEDGCIWDGNDYVYD